MKPSSEALRLPDPLLVRFHRAGRLDEIAKVEEDAQRNITVHLRGRAEPIRFMHLQDMGWVPDGACDGI